MDAPVCAVEASTWYDAERAYRSEHPAEFVTQTTFASVFCHAWNRVTQNKELAKSGFRVAGLFPYRSRARGEVEQNEAEIEETLLAPDEQIYKFKEEIRDRRKV